MRIVYCLNSISHIGGIEAITLFKASALAQIETNTVWVLYTEQADADPFSPSNNVRFVDLKVRYYDNAWPFPLNILHLGFRSIAHKKRMRRVLKHIQPDIVVSTGKLEYRFLPSIKGPWKTIREMHSTKHFRIMNAQTPAQRLIAKLGEWIDYGFIIRRYDQVVLLTQEDRETYWQEEDDRICVIPNPCRFQTDAFSPLTAHRILSVGRLAFEKNFSSLIRAFSLVHSRFPDWRLDIIGDGSDRASLLSEIEKLHLSDVVHLCGSSCHIQEEMLDSSIFVSTSRHEGFSLVILEAISCGLPVVTYSFPCGPKDILQDGINGFLVPPEDESALAEQISRLIQDESLRKQIGVAAKQRSKDFEIEHICELWMALFERLGAS